MVWPSIVPMLTLASLAIILLLICDSSNSYRVYKVYKNPQNAQRMVTQGTYLRSWPNSRTPSIYRRVSTTTRKVKKSAPSRSYRLLRVTPKVSNAPIVADSPKVIYLKEGQVIPFTNVDASVSSQGSNVPFEEGVGPAPVFEASQVTNYDKVPAFDPQGEGLVVPNSIVSNSPSKVKKNKNKRKFLRNPILDMSASHPHPTYLKPPADFKPVIYPNRRLDGVSRGSNIMASNDVSIPVQGPFPFGIPRGLSSWTLGGPQALNRGHYWESLGSDAALSTNYWYPYYASTSYYQSPAKRSFTILRSKSGGKRKFLSNGKPGLSNKKQVVIPSSATMFNPWVVFPSSSFANEPKVSSFSSMIPLQSINPGQDTSSGSVPALPESSLPAAGSSSATPASSSSLQPVAVSPVTGINGRPITSESRRVTSDHGSVHLPAAADSVIENNNQNKNPASRSSSAEGIRTKLAVGLTSWMFGGTRDLTGKHWEMPAMTTDGNSAIDVVPLEDQVPKEGPKDFVDIKDPMMTSDGDYESIVPVVKDPPSELEVNESESGSATSVDTRTRYDVMTPNGESPVIYDEPEIVFNSVNSRTHS